MENNIQKYQWGKVLKWLGTSLDDGVRFVRKPFVARKYAKMGIDVTAPQNKRIIAALSGFDSGRSLNLPDWHLRNSLLRQGVAPELLTPINLQKLISKRIDALDLGLNFPNKYVVKYDIGYNAPAYEYHLFRSTPFGGRRVGTINISTFLNTGDNSIYNSVDMIANKTSGRRRVSGVSEQGYNAVIQDLGHVTSGKTLMSPHITTKVWEKFPKKTLLGNYGEHYYHGWSGNAISGPVWRLEAPTYQQPIKFGNNFDVMSITPNGRFTVDFNKGPMFKFGGKLNE